VLQNYIVVGPRLVKRQLDGLERDNPRVAIFSVDGVATGGVDDVPNLTRTPDVWFYLQSRYAVHRELVPGVLALAQDETRRARWRQESRPAGIALQSPVRLKVPITLPVATWPGDSDFLKLRLRIDYSFWWRLRKPVRMIVQVQHADGSEKTMRAVTQPNTLSDLWIYPWDDAQLGSYFDREEKLWRMGQPRSPVTAVQITFERIDWVSVIPSSINIQSLEAVSLRLQ
jgi:hypothetical protein